MAVPKKKISKAIGGTRRSHNALTAVNLALCPNCQEPRLPHRVCPKCGWYRNRVAIEVEE